MQNIKIDNKYDFEELCFILLKNGYQVSVTGLVNEKKDDIDLYSVDFEKIV